MRLVGEPTAKPWHAAAAIGTGLDVVDRTKCSSVRKFFGRGYGGKLSTYKSHLHVLLGFFTGANNVVALRCGKRHWFFQQHMLARLHTLHRQWHVQIIGHGNDHAGNIALRQQRFSAWHHLRAWHFAG